MEKKNVQLEKYMKSQLKGSIWSMSLFVVMIVLTVVMAMNSIKSGTAQEYVFSCVCAALAFTIFLFGAPNVTTWFKLKIDLKKNEILEFDGVIDQIEYVYDKQGKGLNTICAVRFIEMNGKKKVASYYYNFQTMNVNAYYFSNSDLNGVMPKEVCKFSYYKRSKYIVNLKSYGDIKTFENALSHAVEKKYRKK